MEFLLYLLLGACAGVLAGLFGVGGGIIIVPVLVFSFTLQGFDPSVLTHLAVGTSLATIIFTSINAVREHQRKGAVRWPIFAWMTLGILLGAGFGALTAEAIGHYCGMALVDTIVVGQLAPDELPHQALGWAPTAVFLVAAIGLLQGVQVLAARSIGEGNKKGAGVALRRGLIIALLDMSRFRILRWIGISIGEVVRNFPVRQPLLWL